MDVGTAGVGQEELARTVGDEIQRPAGHLEDVGLVLGHLEGGCQIRREPMTGGD